MEDIIDNPYKNVVVFPKHKKDTPPLSLENIIEKITDNQTEVVNSVSEEIARKVFIELDSLGYDFFAADDSIAYDMLLVLEAIKSLQNKLLDKEHPLQTILNEIFQIENPKSFIEFFLSEDEYIE